MKLQELVLMSKHILWNRISLKANYKYDLIII